MKKLFSLKSIALLIILLAYTSVNFISNNVYAAEVPAGYNGQLGVANETGDNSKTIVPSNYFAWDNWQKDSTMYYKFIPTALVPSGGYKSHDQITAEFLNQLDGDTVGQMMFIGTGFSLMNSSGINVPTGSYLTVAPQGQVKIDSPSVSEWKNVPNEITTVGVPWNIKSGLYKTTNITMFATNDLILTGTMGTTNLQAGPKVSVPEGQTAKVTFDVQYTQEANIPTGYTWARIHGAWMFQPRIIKSSFRSLDTPESEISTQEVSGTGMKMDDAVSAKAKAIEGYVFDHYEYIDQYGVTQTGTADTWNGTMDITKKGIVWWYQKEEVTPTLSKSVDKTSVAVNQELTYTLVAGNTGNTELANPLITDVLPIDSVSEPTDITIELSDGTKRSIGKGIENANTFGEYYEYLNNSQLLLHLGSALDKNETRKISYKTTLMNGSNGDSKVNTATLSGENTTNKATASASVTVKNGTIRLSAPATVTFGEAELPKSIGTNLNRNPDFQIQVVDDRVVKDDFYVTAIESAPFTHSDKISTLNAPLIFKQEDNVEQSITEADAALVFQPKISQSDQPVTYTSAWAKDKGLMLKVPSNSKVGAYTGEITWTLNVGP